MKLKKIAPKVAEIMAEVLNKNQEWINEELEQFKLIIKNYQL